MLKITIVFVFILINSQFVLADDIRSIKLNSSVDNVNFNKVLVYLGSNQTVADPQNNTIVYNVREYVSKSEGVKFTCTTKNQMGYQFPPECILEFNLTKTTQDLEVFEGKLAGALVAKFNGKFEPSKIYRGTGFMPLVAFEKVNIKLPDGSTQSTPRLRIDCDTVANSGGIANSCTLVAVPDQNN